MGAPHHPGWTPSRVAAIRKHYAEGYSASQIAKLIGGISRNGVIGKLARLGLTGGSTRDRASLPPRLGKRPGPKPRSSLPAVEFEPLAPRKPPQVFSTGRMLESSPNKPVRKIRGATPQSRLLTLIHPDFSGCRWPVDGQGADTLFCCAPRRPDDLRYCDTHYQAAVARPLTEAEKAENAAKARRAQAAGGFRFNGGRAA